jgi:Ca2+-binding RTX toxin-like protein
MAVPPTVLANWYPARSPYFVVEGQGEFIVDWGDGTERETIRADDETGLAPAAHDYQRFGGFNVRVYESENTGLGPARLTAHMHTLDAQVFIGGGERGDFVLANAQDNRILVREGNDVAFGFGGNDVLNGADGLDYLHGGEGDDLLIGGADADYLDGAADHDTLQGDEGNDTLFGGEGDDRLEGGSGKDFLLGGAADDRLYGGDGDGDFLLGDFGNDVLDGGAGNDALLGGYGRDQLFGGEGADTFLFQDPFHTPNVSGEYDTVRDFAKGEDKFHFGFVRDDGLSLEFIGTAAFLGDGSDAAKGQVRYVTSAASTTIFGDLDGDGVADFRVTITGVFALDSGDFIFS